MRIELQQPDTAVEQQSGTAEELSIDSLHFLVGTTHEIEAGLAARTWEEADDLHEDVGDTVRRVPRDQDEEGEGQNDFIRLPRTNQSA